MEPGTSIGGARPKVTAQDGHRLCLEKLPERQDKQNIQRIQYAVKPDTDSLELLRRMIFNAMVTNNDDHPRNHAMLRTPGGWQLSPAYDIVPVPLISLERRDPALEAGRFGRMARVYNLLSDYASFGLNWGHAQQVINKMVETVKGWREMFARHKVGDRSIECIFGAILPECFLRKEPPSAQWRASVDVGTASDR